MTRRRPSSPLFPYTTLFRSNGSAPASASASARAQGFELLPAHPLHHLAELAHVRAERRQLLRRNAVLFRSEEHTSELQSHVNLVCRLLLEKKKHRQDGIAQA